MTSDQNKKEIDFLKNKIATESKVKQGKEQEFDKFKLSFFQELESYSYSFIDKVLDIGTSLRDCKLLFGQELQKETDEFISSQKDYLEKSLNNENHWLEVDTSQDEEYWFDDFGEVFFDDLGWIDLGNRLVDLEIKRCKKYNLNKCLYNLGVLIGQKGQGDEKALNLMIEGLSETDEESKYWFFKCGLHDDLIDLRDAFECLSSESQEFLYDFVMKHEDILLKTPIYIEIYPVLKSDKIRQEIRQPMIEGEKNSKKISMVLEPSIELDNIVEEAIQNAQKTNNYSWIDLLISKFECNYPLYHKLDILKEIYKPIKEAKAKEVSRFE